MCFNLNFEHAESICACYNVYYFCRFTTCLITCIYFPIMAFSIIVSKVRAWRLRLAFQGLSCCWASVALLVLGVVYACHLRLLLRSCGPGSGPFRAVWAWGWPFPNARASHLPRFILLISFSDTLLVVSILDIVYDYQLRRLLQS